MSEPKHQKLFDAIGPRVVRDTYGISRQTLHHWRKRCIPHSYRVAFAKLAAEHGQPVPPDFFKGMVS